MQGKGGYDHLKATGRTNEAGLKDGGKESAASGGG